MELEKIASTLRAWIDAFDARRINVTDVRFVADFLMPKKVSDDARS